MSTHGKTTTVAWNSHTIGNVTSIGDVNSTWDTTEDTPYNAASSIKTFLLGFRDLDEITIVCNFDQTDTDGQIAYATDHAAGTARTLLITLPTATGTTWSLPCLPTGMSTSQPRDGVVTMTIKVKPTGAPTFSVATVTGMSAIGFSNDVLIMPSFAIGTFDYVVTITAGQTSTVVTPVDNTAGEIITITTDGAGSQVVATGEASSACVLDVDDVTKIVVTISKANYAPKVYTFNCAVLAA